MDPLQAIVLGVAQGLTEFLPISSSAHLVVVPWLLGWPQHSLAFDVALHLGTLFAVLAFFWRDWVALVGGMAGSLAQRSLSVPRAKQGWLILAATIPSGLAGWLFESEAETILRDVRLVAGLLIVVGLVLLWADLSGSLSKGEDEVSWGDGLLIGLAQAFAIMPGVSRSGATISMGLFRGLEREAAARFSFLLGTPIIAGAAISQVGKVLRQGLPAQEQLPFLLGVVAAALVGYLAIASLLRYLQRHSLLPFVAYRLAFGLGLLVLVWLRGLTP